jgi:Zn-dependent protease with chaperone function
MSSNDTTSRLHMLFLELQEKGLIERDRRLVRCPITLSMRGSSFLNCIRYGPRFCEESLSGFSDDVLRFVLLHEEGHIRKGTSLLFSFMIIPVLLYLIALHQPVTIEALHLGILSSLPAGGLTVAKISLIIALLTVPVTYSRYYRSMYDEEFGADRFAAEAMRQYYKVTKPSALLSALLAGLWTDESADTTKKRFGLLRQRGEYHPPIHERVRRIRDSVDRTDRA